jgi:hypothetical protein
MRCHAPCRHCHYTRHKGLKENRKGKKNDVRRTYLPAFFLRFFEIFSRTFSKNKILVFLGSSYRVRPKNVIKKIEGKNGRKQGLFPQLFCKKVLTWTFSKKFYGVFELPLLKNA